MHLSGEGSLVGESQIGPWGRCLSGIFVFWGQIDPKAVRDPSMHPKHKIDGRHGMRGTFAGGIAYVNLLAPDIYDSLPNL